MTLYVFALNTPVSVTLTELTRARGETAGLPPLGDWLGLTALDTDRVELFPVADLGDMPLSGYLSTAYDAEIDGPRHAARCAGGLRPAGARGRHDRHARARRRGDDDRGLARGASRP